MSCWGVALNPAASLRSMASLGELTAPPLLNFWPGSLHSCSSPACTCVHKCRRCCSANPVYLYKPSRGLVSAAYLLCSVNMLQKVELQVPCRTGKTQICHTLCVTTQLPVEQGGGAGKASPHLLIRCPCVGTCQYSCNA